jgi:hypothetical protein
MKMNLRNELANLNALIIGHDITSYQKALAIKELEYLLTENKMLKQALDESDRKLKICEDSCDIYEQTIKDLDANIFTKNLDTPLEKCWAIRNFIGQLTKRYDLANEIGSDFCDLILKKIDIKEFELVKSYLINNR